MKTRQLANILIKILGLSVCVSAIPRLIVDFYNIVGHLRQVPGEIMPRLQWFPPIPDLVLLTMGVYLLAQSRKVTEILFKNEDE